ncbi:MAG: FtsW/RodA/SpoVE family cell cycle protein [Oscillospiraceae bacterium]|jgi:rod shape determining protein RodA|nr:FtsW/RodA/SpoVE family cell cycle protein [Oscillospiraceae bacterium]
MTIAKRFLTIIRDYFRYADSILMLLCIAASGFGLVMVYSATRSYEGANGYMRIQILATAIGLVAFFVMSLVDIELVTDRWPLLLVFNIAFICTLFIWGVEGDTGNRGWLRFAGAGIQPTEVVKITFALLLAKHICYLRDDSRIGMNSVVSVGSLLLHFGLMFGLIMAASSDLGSDLVFAFIFIVMLFLGGLKLRWLGIGVLMVGTSAPLVWSRFLTERQRALIIAPYAPDVVDPTGLEITWQAAQSRLALASGQITGRGLFKGPLSQSNTIPSKHTDFIFAVIGEELGLLGCLTVIVLLLAIIARCVYVGVKSGSRIKALFCIGIAAMLAFQTFENIGMNVGLTPVIGLTLPFFSYGGSGTLSVLAAMGIVSGIRRTST